MKHKTVTTLSPNLVQLLSSNGTVGTYSRGTLLFEEGDSSQALYLLVEGRLKVYARGQRGRELVFNTLTPGEIFGELFLDGGLRSASVKALADSKCVIIDETQLHEFIGLYPEFSHYLVHKLISRLRHSTQLSKSLALEGVHERTTMLLERVSEKSMGMRVVPASLTQQDIADLIGATREMVNHVIQDLIRDGFVERDGQRRLVLMKPLSGQKRG